MTDHIAATQEDREAAHRYFAWHNNPSWAQEGGEHFDGNWVPDCQGKQDYDPGFMWFSCRVYPNGQWVASLYMGDGSQLETTEIQRAPDKNTARSAVEAWCADRAKHWAERLASTAALQSERDALAARVEALEGENASLRHWAWGHIDCLLLYAAGQYPNDSHVLDAVAFCRIIKPNGTLRMDQPSGKLKSSDFHPARKALGEG